MRKAWLVLILVAVMIPGAAVPVHLLGHADRGEPLTGHQLLQGQHGSAPDVGGVEDLQPVVGARCREPFAQALSDLVGVVPPLLLVDVRLELRRRAGLPRAGEGAARPMSRCAR